MFITESHQAAFNTLNDVVQEYWLPINALTAIMFPIIAFFEITRLQGFAKTGKVSTIPPSNTLAPFAHIVEALCIDRLQVLLLVS